MLNTNLILHIKADPENEGETSAPTSVFLDNSLSHANEGEREPYFEPVVHLPEVKVITNEEEEEEMLRL